MKIALLDVCLLGIVSTLGWQQYSECLIDSRSEEVVTNHKQSDGFGSQFQEIIASVVYAELNNKKFVYTPFKEMEHNYDADPCFIAKKEWLVNFIDNFEVNEGRINSNNAGYKAFFDANVAECANSLSLKKIRKIFRANKNRNNYFNNESFNIVIHVRRPNPHDNRIEGANTPKQLFLDIITQLRKIHASQDLLIHLISQGKSEDFNAFIAHDIILHLNESVEDAFTAMVLADVLVTGRSSFSYAAGLLSEGIVYYIPFWHKPLPHWTSAEMLFKK